MLSLLLSGALLAGPGTTAGMGERSPSFSVAADARTRWVGIEALAVAAPKLESGQGWLGTEQQQAFAIAIQTSSRIHIWYRNVLFERGMPGTFISKLREYAVRFMENDVFHFESIMENKLILEEE